MLSLTPFSWNRQKDKILSKIVTKLIANKTLE